MLSLARNDNIYGLNPHTSMDPASSLFMGFTLAWADSHSASYLENIQKEIWKQKPETLLYSKTACLFFNTPSEHYRRFTSKVWPLVEQNSSGKQRTRLQIVLQVTILIHFVPPERARQLSASKVDELHTAIATAQGWVEAMIAMPPGIHQRHRVRTQDLESR